MIQAQYHEPEEYQSRDIQHKISNNILLIFNLIGIPVVAYGVIEAFELEQYHTGISYIVFALPMFIAGLLRRYFSYKVKVILMLSTIYFLGVSDLFTYGFHGSSLALLIIFMVLSTLFLGIKSGLISLGLSVSIAAIAGALYLQKIIFITINLNQMIDVTFSWSLAIGILFLLGSGMVFSIGVVQERLEKLLGFSQQQQIALHQRTVELEQSNLQLEEELQRRKEILDQLRIAKNHAEESDRFKTAFLNNISHQIRTPMNGIIGFSEVLIDPDLDLEERNRYINLITSCGDDLIHIIDHLVEYALLAREDFKLDIEEISLNQLFQDLEQQYHHKVLEKGLTFLIKGNQDGRLFSDRKRLCQIFENLIENALKFTENGGVEINYLFSTEGILIEISDSGIGVEQTLQSAIFSPFQTGVIANFEDYGGAGLGLAIVKRNLDLIGGEVSFQSEPGLGTKIKVLLPEALESLG